MGRYDGSFGEYQSRYSVKSLNISLPLASLRTTFGGCGINITFGLRQFGIDAVPLSAAGVNFNDKYRDYLCDLGVNIDYIAVDERMPQCATAIVLSDENGNQITGFHPGGALSDRRKKPSAIAEIEDYQLAVLAPESADLMLRQARDIAELGVPIFFDPGQWLSEFSDVELRELIGLSDYVICNEHEWDILQKNACLKADVAGLIAEQEAELCARIGALTATFNLEHEDPQGYRFDEWEFAQRYRDAFGGEVPSAIWQS